MQVYKANISNIFKIHYFLDDCNVQPLPISTFDRKLEKLLQDSRKCHGTSWNVMEYHEKSENVMEPNRKLENVMELHMEHHGKPENVMEPNRKLENVMELHRKH